MHIANYLLALKLPVGSGTIEGPIKSACSFKLMLVFMLVLEKSIPYYM